MNWAKWRPFLKKRWFSLKVNVGSIVSAAGRKKSSSEGSLKKKRRVFLQEYSNSVFVPDTLNRRRPALSEPYLYIHQIKWKRVLLVMCRILGRADIEKGSSVFSKYNVNRAVNIGSGSFSMLIWLREPPLVWWLAVGWCFLCWAVNTDTSFTKFSCKMLLLACALFYSCSWRLCWYRPCADFPLLSYHCHQFCNRIKGIPQFPKIEVQEVYCPAEGSQNNQRFILFWHTDFQFPTLGPCT